MNLSYCVFSIKISYPDSLHGKFTLWAAFNLAFLATSGVVQSRAFTNHCVQSRRTMMSRSSMVLVVSWLIVGTLTSLLIISTNVIYDQCITLRPEFLHFALNKPYAKPGLPIRGIWKSHHFWCDFAFTLFIDPFRLRRLLHSQYSTYKYKKTPLCSQLDITWSGEVWGQEDGYTPWNLTTSQKFTNSWTMIVLAKAQMYSRTSPQQGSFSHKQTIIMSKLESTLLPHLHIITKNDGINKRNRMEERWLKIDRRQ